MRIIQIVYVLCVFKKKKTPKTPIFCWFDTKESWYFYDWLINVGCKNQMWTPLKDKRKFNGLRKII